jgi:hypothetical protein
MDRCSLAAMYKGKYTHYIIFESVAFIFLPLLISGSYSSLSEIVLPQYHSMCPSRRSLHDKPQVLEVNVKAAAVMPTIVRMASNSAAAERRKPISRNSAAAGRASFKRHFCGSQ